MTRLNAALLAGAVTVLLFGAVLALVNWLMGLPGFWAILDSNAAIIGVIVLAISSLVIAITIALHRRGNREQKDEQPTPLRPSERLTGRREL
jgi:membrane protein implicated in regulation of membrane protease activity